MSPQATTDPEAPVREGDIFAGKYRCEQVLGVGGMGVVVAATHLELGQRVAVKFLLKALAANPEGATRFLREARAAVALTSEHAVRVHDVGHLDSGAPFMVMEFLEGKDLAEVLEEEGPLTVDRCVEYTLQAIDAIAEAHAAGIVHRDLKPSNLFLARRGRSHRIKVLDFGISKVESQAPLALTGTSAILGSPFYMAPEQMRSTRTVDHRADIWSLGVILYELSTGRLPFQASTLTELCLMIAQDTPALLRTLRADAPGELEEIVARCLEKEPASRFQSVGELATRLETLKSTSSHGAVATAPLSQPDPSQSSPVSLSSSSSGSSPSLGPLMNVAPNAPALPTTSGNWGKSGSLTTPRPSSARLWLALGGVAAALALVAGVLLIRASTRGSPPSSSRAQPAAAARPPPIQEPASSPPPVVSTEPPVASTEPPVAVAPATPVVPAARASRGTSEASTWGASAAVSLPAAPVQPRPRAATPTPPPKEAPAPTNSASTFSHDRQ